MSAAGTLDRQFFDMLGASQFWPPDQMRTYQRGQLAQLLRHARAHVPFFRERLAPVFAANGDIDWNRWGDLPILKRQDIVDHGEELRAVSLPAGHGARTQSTTTGTSGAAITLISTQLAHVALNANRFRAYGWHDVDCGRDCVAVFGDDPDEAPWPTGRVLGPWGAAWDPARIDGALIRLNRLTSYENIVEFIARRQPAYLTTGPNTALAIALTARRLAVDIRLEAYLAQGGMLEAVHRDAMRDIFGARTVELYSSKEAGHIAHGCPAGEGLHVNAESVLFEIVDEHGAPVPPGVSGRVVITPFFNSAQPLIRYDQGDLASWQAPCGCGRPLPRISNVIGRSTTLFYHPDGRVCSAFLSAYRPLLDCSAWQVAQTGPTRFEVRYVPLRPDMRGDEAALAERMRAFYFDDAEIGFVMVDAIAPGPGGKPREYVNEWLPP